MPVPQRRNNSTCPYGRAVIRAEGVEIRVRPPTPREHVLLTYLCPCGVHTYRFILHRSQLTDRDNNELISHIGGRLRRMENLAEQRQQQMGERPGTSSAQRLDEEEFVER